MKKDFRLGFEKLENITLLSSAPWYVDSIKADTVWNSINASLSKPVVQIYINNVLRYSVNANVYRNDTKSSNGFKVSMNRKFLNLKSNLLEIRVVDSMHHLSSVAYKGYVGR